MTDRFHHHNRKCSACINNDSNAYSPSKRNDEIIMIL